MLTTDRNERIFKALADVDPQFEQLCGILYGPDATPEEIWDDVFGVAKRQSLTPEQRRQRTQARIGLASNVIGLGAGVAATGAALKSPMLRGKIGSIIPPGKAATITRRGKIVAGGLLGLQVANTGGDVITNAVLRRESKKGTKVGKGLPTMAQLRQGTLASMRKLKRTPLTPPAAAPLTPERAAANATGNARAQKAGQVLASPLGTPKRKVAAGATALAGATAVQNRPVTKNESWTVEGEFSKFDTDKRLAFGWASVVEKDGVPVIDRQGDFMTEEDIEKAAYDYVQRARIGGDMHRRTPDDRPHHVSDLVESMVFTKEKIAKMGLPETFPVGWWVGLKFHDDEVWEMVKKGERTGFSIHGKGKRQDAAIDEIMAR